MAGLSLSEVKSMKPAEVHLVYFKIKHGGGPEAGEQKLEDSPVFNQTTLVVAHDEKWAKVGERNARIPEDLVGKNRFGTEQELADIRKSMPGSEAEKELLVFRPPKDPKDFKQFDRKILNTVIYRNDAITFYWDGHGEPGAAYYSDKGGGGSLYGRPNRMGFQEEI